MGFEGLKTTYTDCPSGARVFSYLRASSGADVDSKLPILVLLHGYPQNSLMYKEFVKEIPPQWTILVPDLPGYGNSTKPIADDSRAHSKREWAKDIVAVVDALFGTETKFIVYGHDRGARVSYRLGLDFPTRIAGVAVLDIVPGTYVWDAMRLETGHAVTRGTHHWIFLATPRPFPETMISSNPRYYFEYTITGWAGSGMKNASLDWVQDGVAQFLDPEKGKNTIATACEDYRAGATHDIQDDFSTSDLLNPLKPRAANAAPIFAMPILALYSASLQNRYDVAGIWKGLGSLGKVTCHQIGDKATGHFIVNEQQADTGRRTREWLSEFFE